MVLKKWGIPILIAILFNALMISIIPTLVRQVPEKKDLSEFQSIIDVVRLKPPEPPVTPPQEKEPPEPEEEPPKPLETPTAIPKPEITQEIDLPFDVDLDIPSLAGSVQLPVITAFEVPKLRSEYAMEDIDQPLVVRAQMPPLYPMKARRQGITGWVNVTYLVNEEGFVEDVTITSAEPEGVFESSVIRAVSAWRFNPGTVDGVPVKTRIKQHLSFTLDEDN